MSAAPVPKPAPPAPRAKALRLTDSGVHRIANVVTALRAPTAEIEAERVGRGLRSERRASARLRYAAAFGAAVADAKNLAVADDLDLRHEKTVRELAEGHKPLGAEVLLLRAEQRAAMAAVVLEGLRDEPGDVDRAHTLFLAYLTARAVEREEAERDAGAVVVEGEER